MDMGCSRVWRRVGQCRTAEQNTFPDAFLTFASNSGRGNVMQRFSITCHVSQPTAAGAKRCHSGGRQMTAHSEQRIIWQLQQQALSIFC